MARCTWISLVPAAYAALEMWFWSVSCAPPLRSEFAFGAVSEYGRTYVAKHAEACGVTVQCVGAQLKVQLALMHARRTLYTPCVHQCPMVIAVYEGPATGADMQPALLTVRTQPMVLVCSVPLVTPTAAEKVRSRIYELICLDLDQVMQAAGDVFRCFAKVVDAEVSLVLED